MDSSAGITNIAGLTGVIGTKHTCVFIFSDYHNVCSQKKTWKTEENLGKKPKVQGGLTTGTKKGGSPIKKTEKWLQQRLHLQPQARFTQKTTLLSLRDRAKLTNADKEMMVTKRTASQSRTASKSEEDP